MEEKYILLINMKQLTGNSTAIYNRAFYINEVNEMINKEQRIHILLVNLNHDCKKVLRSVDGSHHKLAKDYGEVMSVTFIFVKNQDCEFNIAN